MSRHDAPTLDEVRTWPATCGVPQAAKAMGISETCLRDAIRRGESPVKTVPLNARRHVIITASLVRLLEGA